MGFGIEIMECNVARLSAERRGLLAKRLRHGMAESLRRCGMMAFLALIAIGLSGCRSGSREGLAFALQPGDLIFQDLDGGALAEAIEKVTTGYRGAHLTHVGIVTRAEAGRLAIIEASRPGVRVVSVEEFLARSRDANGKPKAFVGRLKPSARGLVPEALRAAHALQGKPYDTLFDAENDAYYCSELVYQCFRDANGGVALFALQPMTFIDPDTGATFPAWRDYFQGMNALVPEGMPGINPGGLSRHDLVEIVHIYGTPDGWK